MTGGPGAAHGDLGPTGDERADAGAAGDGELTVVAEPEVVAAEPETAPAAGDGGEGAEILADIAGLVAERDEYLLALQRLQADFENYRKRVVRQQEEQSARAAQDLVGKVLAVLDTLDLARAHLGAEEGAEPSGEARALEQARAQLLDVLTKEGLERVDAAGVEFDPSVHDAVAHAPADEAGQNGSGDEAGAHPEVTVEEVLRAGYRWRGQVLRPAMVRVRG